MAKYWCKNCDTIIELNDDLDFYGYIKICPRCETPTDEYFVKIPDYETPAQYEKRTGEPYPENGAVWYSYKNQDLEEKGWFINSYKIMLNAMKGYGGTLYIVIASPPVPPPDDFVPEGV